MTIVTLEDGTKYLVDTDKRSTAKYVVDYKLRQKNDYRSISDYDIMEECSLDKDSKYYNSSDPHDGVPLQAKNGWSYKWGDRGTDFSRD